MACLEACTCIANQSLSGQTATHGIRTNWVAPIPKLHESSDMMSGARGTKTRAIHHYLAREPVRIESEKKASKSTRRNACATSELDGDAPEGGVGLVEGDADVPGFVAAPDDFAHGAAIVIGEDDFDGVVQRKIGADNGHAAGVADVNGDAVGAMGTAAVLPFHEETQAGFGAFMRAHLDPALFQLPCGIQS